MKIIGVADVSQSFKWYQSLLGLSQTAPAHDYFGQIVDSDGTVLLCLDEWGAHEQSSKHLTQMQRGQSSLNLTHLRQQRDRLTQSQQNHRCPAHVQQERNLTQMQQAGRDLTH